MADKKTSQETELLAVDIDGTVEERVIKGGANWRVKYSSLITWLQTQNVGGDMFKATYDPTNVNGDAFDYNNFFNTPVIPPALTGTPTEVVYFDAGGLPTSDAFFTRNAGVNFETLIQANFNAGANYSQLNINSAQAKIRYNGVATNAYIDLTDNGINIRNNVGDWFWATANGAAGSVLTDVAGDGVLSFQPVGGSFLTVDGLTTGATTASQHFTLGTVQPTMTDLNDSNGLLINSVNDLVQIFGGATPLAAGAITLEVNAGAQSISGVVGAANSSMAFNLTPSEFNILSVGTQLFRAAAGSVLIGTGAPDASAALEIQSTVQGFLPPKMTGVEADAITAADGLVVYIITANGTFGAVGLYCYVAGTWTGL